MHLHGHGTALSAAAQLQVLAASCWCTRRELGKRGALPRCHPGASPNPPEGFGALRQGHQVGRVLLVVVVRLMLLIPGVRGPGGAAGPAGVYARMAWVYLTSCGGLQHAVACRTRAGSHLRLLHSTSTPCSHHAENAGRSASLLRLSRLARYTPCCLATWAVGGSVSCGVVPVTAASPTQ